MSNARIETFRIKDLTLSARCFGPEGAPVLVFLHGYLTAARTWDGVCSRLSPRFRCVALDLPACGDSPAPRRSVEWSLDLFAGVCDGLLDALRIERVNLVGSQMGGSIATWYTAKHPERVSRLAVMASGILGETTANMRLYRALASPWTGWLVKRILPRGQFMKRWSYAHGPERGANLDNFERYFDQFRRTADVQSRIALGVRASFGTSFSAAAPLLSGLKTPTLLLFGEADRIVPPSTGDRFHELLPESRLVKIPGCGDFPQEEFPEVVAEELGRFFAADGAQGGS
ncbi:alpha/beta fold hydrolase [Sorangium sp. So ce1151]|uniref:alpha/beta fold hydrolase n=1 Tax=Sorangium sp. So ce1151 TaxID=3133332 RepID=UPI003F5E2237